MIMIDAKRILLIFTLLISALSCKDYSKVELFQRGYSDIEILDNNTLTVLGFNIDNKNDVGLDIYNITHEGQINWNYRLGNLFDYDDDYNKENIVFHKNNFYIFSVIKNNILNISIISRDGKLINSNDISFHDNIPIVEFADEVLYFSSRVNNTYNENKICYTVIDPSLNILRKILIDSNRISKKISHIKKVDDNMIVYISKSDKGIDLIRYSLASMNVEKKYSLNGDYKLINTYFNFYSNEVYYANMHENYLFDINLDLVSKEISNEYILKVVPETKSLLTITDNFDLIKFIDKKNDRIYQSNIKGNIRSPVITKFEGEHYVIYNTPSVNSYLIIQKLHEQ